MNILFITSDQQRADCYGFEGRRVKTPHLDMLARQGTRFSACITPNLVCQPTRASILTGLLPGTHGVSDNGIVIGASINSFTFASQPFVWSTKMGLHRLQATLAGHGAVIPNGVTLTNVLAISADGTTIVGLWQDASFNQGPWIAYLHGKTALLK